MFQLTLIDHIRLSFAGVLSAYEGHADAAARLVRWAWYGKMAMLGILGLAAASTLVAQQLGGAFRVVASAAAALAFAIWAIYVALDPEPRAYAHRASAARLWLLCEKYRALLTEVHDQLVDVPALTARRDALLQETSATFERAAPADQQTYDIARKALTAGQKGHYSDQEIDQYLPAALRRGPSAAPAATKTVEPQMTS
jgi:hypothetical protein